MSARRIDPRRVKRHHSYTVEEAARTLDVHKNTVRGWRAKGLETVDRRRPLLFDGATLRAFLEKQRAGRKQPCRPGTLYCFSCRAPRPPALGMIDYVPINPASGNLKALCATCETIMHRRARRADLERIMPGIAVQMAGAQSRLKGSASPSLNCDLERMD